MTLSLPVAGARRRAWTLSLGFRRLTKLDVFLASILFGPLGVLQVSGRTPSVYWVDLVVALVALAMLIRQSVADKGFDLRLPRAVMWALFYVLVAATSLAQTLDPLYGIAVFKLRLMPIIVFMLACRQPASEDDVDHFLRSVIVFGAALALFSLYNWYQFFTGMRTLAEELGPKDMLQTSFGRSNYLASMFVIILPINLVYIYRSRRFRDLAINGASLVLIVIALAFTQSRGAMISALCGLLAWAALSLARSITVRRLATAVLIMAAVVTGAILLWSRIPEDVRSGLTVSFGALLQQAEQGNAGGGRTDLWAAAIKGALSSDLVGIGLGNQAIWLAALGLDASAHSLYLETLLETGLVGLFALLGLLYTFWMTLWRLWVHVDRRRRPIAGAMIASFLTAIVNVSQEPSFWAPQYGYLFWMMMGIAYAWLRLESVEKAKPLSESA